MTPLSKTEKGVFSSTKKREYANKYWTHPIQQNAGVKIAKMLISKGAEVDHVDKAGCTPCKMATLFGTLNYNEMIRWHKNIFVLTFFFQEITK